MRDPELRKYNCMCQEWLKRSAANSLCKDKETGTLVKKEDEVFRPYWSRDIIFPSLPNSFYRDDKPQPSHTTNTSLLSHYNKPCFHPRLHPLTDQSETVAVTRGREFRRKNKHERWEESSKKTVFRSNLFITVLSIIKLSLQRVSWPEVWRKEEIR
jgi:hypothetical protein